MKRFICVVEMFFLLALCSCSLGNDSGFVPPEQLSYTSTTPVEDCFFCGDEFSNVTNSGQNNIGIISLNTFEIMPIEINQYDNHGNLIEENTGRMTMRGFGSESGGFNATVTETPDRGYANVSIEFYNDETLDLEKAASFLCEDCLNKLLEGIYNNEFGLGVINFSTGEIQVFEENKVGFGSGDFYIHCDFIERAKKDKTRKLNLLVFYSPLRYGE